jgi:8-oxo-dGTP diphosphatase
MEPHLLHPLRIFEDNHGNWRYDTIIASADAGLVAHEQNDESQQVEWVKFEEVVNKNLHPSFARSWPQLLPILRELLV